MSKMPNTNLQHAQISILRAQLFKKYIFAPLQKKKSKLWVDLRVEGAHYVIT